MSLTFLLFQFLVLIFSVMIHEVAHGYMAERLGDPTARLAGRLNLNPINHIDVFGSLILPALLVFTHSPIILGWAKPVPYNPNNLYKDYKNGPLKVALAGPLANFVVMLVVGLGARVALPYVSATAIALLGFVAYINLFLALFNLVPIPPLDGSKLLTLFFPNINVERIGFGGIIIVFAFLYFFSGILAILAAKIFVLIAGSNVFYAMNTALVGF